jgi:hypothetical protein
MLANLADSARQIQSALSQACRIHAIFLNNPTKFGRETYALPKQRRF